MFALVGIAQQSLAQSYINNSTTLQAGANFNIAGTAQSNTLKTFAGTSATGTAHFHLYNGDGNVAANLRWTQAFISEEGANNAGSDFRLFRYSNTGTFLGFGLAIERATGNVTVGNLTSTWLNFNPVGLAAPTFTTRSAGSKITLWNAPVNATTAGWDIGMEDSHIWFGVPAPLNTQGFKFYAGISQVGRLDGFGALDLGGQGRFKGWYTANGTGMAAELGVTAANIASLIGFDRTTGATKYIPLQLAGGTTSTNQTVLLLNEKGATIAPGNTAVNPQTALSVNGLITARQVKVTQTGWADYIFHKDYQLPTLAEVEKYVNTHQHLEGIPSAAEVEKDGVDVGEMNKKLLAKIEELTLYLIEQNKKIAALEEWKMRQEKKGK
ncbi:MAG: hypothetical protein J7623_23930 [Chitinophaga sp.]|uniref:hypothetical protein n=1 Tax=Chitinophaga sp. TaxID=1869181 RepID=UPI001B23236D|nr:hypothetical protein [Chitinophaga sp.]MBO9731711.1 hypothetical protein [Chitinophaga sp.]